MSLRFKLQLVVMSDDDEVCVDDVVVLDKQHERLEHLGLSLGEAKTLLLELQRQVVTRQIAAFLATRAACPSCGRPRGIKDPKTVVFRTLFGNLELASPRLRRCPCQHAVVPTSGAAKCFGFVQSQDGWPRRRLVATLQAQGLRSGPKLAFLSDGEDSIRSLQWHLSPRAQHVLDWFHLAMRLQRLRQFLVGLTHLDKAVGTQMQSALERTKWSLWHGKPKQAFDRFREVEWRIWQFATRYPKFSALARAVNEFQRYIDRNAYMIPDYGARWRAGQVISTAFIESLVNSLLAKRFAKKQSMQWTPEGAHLLLQMRTRTLNGDLASTFRNRYPDFSVADQALTQHSLAA